MEHEILEKIEQQEKKIDAIYVSVEKTRKYFLWTLVITAVTILLPIIGFMIVIPWFLGIFNSELNSLM
jgi:hypothetical protein